MATKSYNVAIPIRIPDRSNLVFALLRWVSMVRGKRKIITVLIMKIGDKGRKIEPETAKAIQVTIGIFVGWSANPLC